MAMPGSAIYRSQTAGPAWIRTNDRRSLWRATGRSDGDFAFRFEIAHSDRPRQVPNGPLNCQVYAPVTAPIRFSLPTGALPRAFLAS
jgi:hypothetical protein